MKTHISATDACPPRWIDPRAVPTYIIVIAQAFVGLLMLGILGFTIAPEIWLAFGACPLLIASGIGSRRLGYSRIGGFVETFALTYAQGLAGLLLLTPLAALSGPLQDAFLAAADQALGLDWRATAIALLPYSRPLAVFYHSFDWQGPILLLMLFAVKQTDRAWRFVFAASLALLLCVIVFPFFPADGAFVFYRMPRSPILTAPWEFPPVLHAIRDGARHLDFDLVSGIVSFPSYHSATAVLFAWAAWRTRLRFPVLALNFGLIVATPLLGSHYFVDIIAGLACGAVAIIAAGRVVRWRGDSAF